MKRKIKSKVIVEHSDNCFAKNSKHVWSGIPSEKMPFFFGNFNANKHAMRGNYHIWINVICNDPKCPAIKAVHSSVLMNA